MPPFCPTVPVVDTIGVGVGVGVGLEEGVCVDFVAVGPAIAVVAGAGVEVMFGVGVEVVAGCRVGVTIGVVVDVGELELMAKLPRALQGVSIAVVALVPLTCQ